MFIEKLLVELKYEIDQLIDSHPDLLPLKLEQKFIDNFCIDIYMMIEVYVTPLDEKEHT